MSDAEFGNEGSRAEGRFREKAAVVTGGGQGIGRAIALRLAREGAKVLVADIQQEKAEACAEEIGSSGGSAEAFRVDLSDPAQIDAMLDRCLELFGSLDILVNCAGIVQSKDFLAVTPEEWDRVTDINQRGTAFCTQKAAVRMIAGIPEQERARVPASRSWGKIVNLSSISGRRGRAYQLHYAASKAAIISITQSAALALARYGINVNAVAPSVVFTPMWEQNIRDKSNAFGVDARKESEEFIARIPLKRAGTPEEMAAAVCFLCSADADYITGQTINVDGGFEMN